jgi:small GTP-binding protein
MSISTIALAGNPNSGKTTLFNNFTGARQHVGNYPGVTVEQKSGTYTHDGKRYHIVDLPGTYSLTAYSLEEVVARDYLVNEKPAAVINIVDAANLERNRYLTIQFMELGIPVIVALNMMDVAESRGIVIDTEKLSTLLGVPVVATVARKGRGKEELGAVADRIVGEQVPVSPLNISYGTDVDEALADMVKWIETDGLLTDTYPAHWLALKYMARMAFMLDRVFRMFGLHGASVMAFIVSGGIAGGCAVPGVMATRTLKSPPGAAGHAADRAVHELRCQASRVRPAGGCVLCQPQGHSHVSDHHRRLGWGPAGGQTPAGHRGAGRGHAVCHGTAPIPAADVQGVAHPYLGAGLAVCQEGRNRYSRHLRYPLGHDDVSGTPRFGDRRI